ncbi:MAG: TonB-dependent receptor [Thermaurantimonas sp.]|uniref:TonB-dependent receptor n=1 Tax=Thermaurantimonas sp. TaxID=2681568 RepID=UPI003919A240
MKIKQFFLSVLLSSGAVFSYAQRATRVTVSGFVSERRSAERLVGVNVYIPNLKVGTITNNYGYYSLSIPRGRHTIVFSMLGFTSRQYEIDLRRDTVINVELQEEIAELEEVVIIAEKKQAENVQMSSIDLPMKTVKKIPMLFGETDLLRAIQYLPGVQSGNEGFTGIYVRGGSPDQNLILLDGVPVYNVSHLFGFFSVFNSDAIKSVQLYKGGFPARFAGRLSSVIDITMKEGNMRKFGAEGSIGLISSRLTVEGPILKDKASFIFSGRRTYLDMLTRPLIGSGNDDATGGYYFGDFNGKINYILNPKNRLYLSYYGGIDKFFFRDRTNFGTHTETVEGGLQWGNNTGSLRWNHLFNNKMFVNTTLNYTRYRFTTYFSQTHSTDPSKNVLARFFSYIQDFSLRSDWEYALNPNHYLRFGVSSILHDFRPGALQVRDNQANIDSLVDFSKRIQSVENGLYIEDEMSVGNRTKLNLGLHYAQNFVKGVTYQGLQPRLSGRYMLTDKTSIKASYVMMQQFIHLLSNTGIGLPTDLWVPATDKVKPQLAHQVAIGATYSMNTTYEFSAEAYYKHMSNLIEYKNGASYYSTVDWQSQVHTGGRGWSYGLELFAEKKLGNTTGWIGYTLSWSWRQFKELNNGLPYPFRFDRRHDVSIVLNHKFSERFDIGFTWVYGTGIATNIPMGQFATLPIDFWSGYSPVFINPDQLTSVTYFGPRNSFRMPAYHRADIGLNFHKKLDFGIERTWNISLYNLYSRRNPFFIYIDYFNNNDPDKGAYKLVSLFPIIPSVSYYLKF